MKNKKMGKTKVLSVLLTIVLVASTTMVTLIDVGKAANGGSYTEVQPASQNVNPGDSFSVDIYVDSDTYNLKAASIDLYYDSSVFSVSSITEGTLLGSPTLTEPGSGDDGAGHIHYGITRASGNTPVPASGTFITINFNVIGGIPGNTYLLDLQDDLRDENGNPIPGVAVHDGNVTIAGGPLEADANGPYSGVVGSPVNFYGSASGGTPPYTYEWDFDYDGVFTVDEKGERTSYVYEKAGRYTAALRVIDSILNENVDITNVDIKDSPYVYRILPPHVYPGGNCAVTLNISNYGISVEIIERFPDGFVYVNSSPAENFLLENNTIRLSGENLFTYYLEVLVPPGVYTFHGILKDENGEEFIIEGDCNLTVMEIPLSVDIGNRYTGYVDERIYFSPSIIGGFPPYVIQWDLNNDGLYEMVGKNVSYSWSHPGNYTISLKIVDDNGTTVTDEAVVTIYKQQKEKNIIWFLVLILIFCCFLFFVFLRLRYR